MGQKKMEREEKLKALLDCVAKLSPEQREAVKFKTEYDKNKPYEKLVFIKLKKLKDDEKLTEKHPELSIKTFQFFVKMRNLPDIDFSDSPKECFNNLELYIELLRKISSNTNDKSNTRIEKKEYDEIRKNALREVKEFPQNLFEEVKEIEGLFGATRKAYDDGKKNLKKCMNKKGHFLAEL